MKRICEHKFQTVITSQDIGGPGSPDYVTNKEECLKCGFKKTVCIKYIYYPWGTGTEVKEKEGWV